MKPVMVPALKLLLTVGLLSLCVAKEFFVTPNSTQPCQSPCHTLDYYAQNTSLFAGYTNISLIFLEGVHTLSYDLTVAAYDEITLKPQADNLKPQVVTAKNNKVELAGQLVKIYKLIFNKVKRGNLGHSFG